MPNFIEEALTKFQRTTLELEPDVITKALTSRERVFESIKKLAQTNKGFPQLYGNYTESGSLARNTQIKPLENLEILLLLNGTGTEVTPSPTSTFTYWLKLNHPTVPLSLFPDKYSYVSSKKILSSLRNYLTSLSDCQSAEINPTQSAIILKLTSYDWNFEIVPAIPVDQKNGQRIYYLIPDSLGNWLRVNPQIDLEHITAVDRHHKGKFLSTIKLLKFWNLLPHKPRLSDPYFETLGIKVFQNTEPITDLTFAIKDFFEQGSELIQISCPDPKGLEPNLDSKVDSATKEKVALAIKEASKRASNALLYESRHEIEPALREWQHIFGEKFLTSNKSS